ncbi:SCO family protein [Sphingobacterium sp. Mn56C]|uniref:SCO family protein n=1 Tax=Sphingobacterium sp. Mn56C TaxID=3395261 RepID=UPI003BD8CAAB
MFTNIRKIALQCLVAGFMLSAMVACNSSTSSKNELPILGERETQTIIRDGKEYQDTIYHVIPKFRFVDQDSNWISNQEVDNKIYLADFFFTRCPTICPLLSKNVLAIAQHFKDEPNFIILSHSIDPKYDTPQVLKDYAEKLGAPQNWRFLNGPQEEIYPIAGKDGYFSFATENPDLPGGFDHSGALTLVDRQGHVRAVYDGTDVESVDKAIQDINKLLQQK